jgi:hypothetical protein
VSERESEDEVERRAEGRKNPKQTTPVHSVPNPAKCIMKETQVDLHKDTVIQVRAKVNSISLLPTSMR